MSTSAQRTNMEAYLLGLLGRSDRLSYYAASRGWGFVMTWAHRVAGLMLVLYLLFHMVTLSGLQDPSKFASKMDFLDNFFFSFLEWTLAFPVIFHALNGSRLILYEVFGVRNDRAMTRWVFLLTALYVLTLALVMLMGDQHVSTGFFWLTALTLGLIASAVVGRKLWNTGNHILWKLQRITGAFLLPMVSGHMFFMHLNHRAGHDVETILARLSGMGMKTLGFVLVVSVFFHAGFGLNTIIGDYVEDRRMRTGLTMVTTFLMTVFAYTGVKLICTI